MPPEPAAQRNPDGYPSARELAQILTAMQHRLEVLELRARALEVALEKAGIVAVGALAQVVLDEYELRGLTRPSFKRLLEPPPPAPDPGTVPDGP